MIELEIIQTSVYYENPVFRSEGIKNTKKRCEQNAHTSGILVYISLYNAEFKCVGFPNFRYRHTQGIDENITFHQFPFFDQEFFNIINRIVGGEVFFRFVEEYASTPIQSEGVHQFPV